MPTQVHPVVGNWLETPKERLDEIFLELDAGAIPIGPMSGTAIVAPSTKVAKWGAKFARWMAWQGKIFDPKTETLINSVSRFRIKAIRAKVYQDPSWTDGRPATIIDYSETSFFARNIRDEIRQIEPGVYLGKVWWKRLELIHFALSVPRD